MSVKKEYFALVPFDYDVAGATLDRGEIFEMKGHRNDEKLVGLGYCKLYTAKKSHKCDTCGRRFVNESYYYSHKSKVSCFVAGKEVTRAEYAEQLGMKEKQISKDLFKAPTNPLETIEQASALVGK